jgi:pectate lyase
MERMGRAYQLAVAILAAAAALSGPLAQAASTQVVTYPAPAGQPISTEYAVKVRTPGGSWRDLDLYRVVVGLDPKTDSAMAIFDSSGTVEVSVTKTSGAIDSALVRPRSYGIKPTVAGNGKTATFTLSRPLKVSFEVNGDRLHNLQLFANPIERNVPRAGKRGVIYYGPGVHTIPGDHVLDVPSNTTVYLAGGAVVRGGLLIKNAHNVIVRGRGVLSLPDDSWAPVAIMLERASQVGIRDITVLGSHVTGVDLFNSSRVTIANLKVINSDLWGDGLDVEASSDVLVGDSFLRTSDDSIAVYASRYGFLGDSRNVTVKNTSLWADVAHPILIGTHGDPDRSDTIEQIVFQNLDILEHNEDVDLYQGAMAVNAGDNVAVRSVRFDHIRVDHFSLGQLVNVKVFLNADYNKKPGRRVSDIFFRDVSYEGSGARPSHIEGFDPSRTVSNVVFENLVENGRTILAAAGGDIVVGDFTTGIVFRRQPRTIMRNDGDRRAIRYFGHWTAQAMAGFASGDGHIARKTGSRMSFSFHARQARIYGLTSPASGQATIFVDGKLRANLDSYSTERRTRQILFDTGVLSSGSHRVELRVTGKKSILSTGTAVALDGVEIVS